MEPVVLYDVFVDGDGNRGPVDQLQPSYEGGEPEGGNAPSVQGCHSSLISSLGGVIAVDISRV